MKRVTSLVKTDTYQCINNSVKFNLKHNFIKARVSELICKLVTNCSTCLEISMVGL